MSKNLLKLTTECQKSIDRYDLSIPLATALKNRWK